MGNVPGVWLVLSGWSPELVPERNGSSPSSKECQALAIALCAVNTARSLLAFRARLGTESQHVSAPVDLVALAETLARPPGGGPQTVATDPLGRLQIDLIEWPIGEE